MLPLDIELEIIKSLPVKSLIRFMSVCKAWKSFISCSEFVAGYRALPTQPHRLLIHNKLLYKNETEVNYICFVDEDDTFSQQQKLTVPPILQLPNLSKVIDCSQGLLCLHAFFRKSEDSRTRMVVLWNPSIRKSIAVDVPNVLPEPSEYDYVIGFGVCTDTMDPKLVKITFYPDWLEVGTIVIPTQVEVFTLSSGEWKISRGNVPRISIQFTWFQAVIGQFIYWLAYDNSNGGVDHNLIMSFDLRTEEFREINLPDSLTPSYVELFIYRVKGSLVVVEYDEIYLDPVNKVCHVWMMDHTKEFKKMFTVDVPNTSVSRIMGFTKSCKPIVETHNDINDLDSQCAFVVYDPCSEHIKNLGIHGDEYSFGSSYTESLLLLDHDDGQIVRC